MVSWDVAEGGKLQMEVMMLGVSRQGVWKGRR